jgi:hypothetical protein
VARRRARQGVRAPPSRRLHRRRRAGARERRLRRAGVRRFRVDLRCQVGEPRLPRPPARRLGARGASCRRRRVNSTSPTSAAAPACAGP